VQEQIKMIRKRFEKKRYNQFYTGSPHRATSSLLYTTCRESSTNSINCLHTINQSIPTPRRNQNTAKLIYCSPHPPINFSKNTRLIPIAQTSQFLLPVEIRTLLNWSTAPRSLQSISAKSPRLIPIARPVNFYSRRNQNPANWSTTPCSFQSISAENTGLLLKPKPVQTFNEFHKITMKIPQILIQTGSRRV